MSQDNENKPDDLDFDFMANLEDQNNKVENPIIDENFNLFEDSEISFQKDSDGAAQPEVTESAASVADDSEGLDTPVYSPFQTGEEPVNSAASETLSETSSENSTAAPTISVDDPKGKKKKKEKEKKPKPEKKKKERKEGSKKPMELGAKLSLALGVLLLLALIAVNVLLIVLPPYKDFSVGFTSIIYYLVGVDLIGGIGIVAVPFLFYVYQKDIDVFKVLLGISTMTLSLGVILLMTAVLRYDFAMKPTSPLPQIVKPNLTQDVPAE